MTGRIDRLPLQPCKCGNDDPAHGLMAPPTVYYVHCCNCGEWVEADTEAALVAAWNVTARKVRGVAA